MIRDAQGRINNSTVIDKIRSERQNYAELEKAIFKQRLIGF